MFVNTYLLNIKHQMFSIVSKTTPRNMVQVYLQAMQLHQVQNPELGIKTGLEQLL